MGNYAARITELRKKVNLTQAELGEKLNVTPQAVSKWENGLSEPDIETLKKMSEMFNVSLDYLLTGKKDKNDTPTQEEPKVVVVEKQASPKIIRGYCEDCSKPVGPNEYVVKHDGVAQHIYCHQCNQKRERGKRDAEQYELEKEFKGGFIWGAVAFGAALIVALIAIFAGGLTSFEIAVACFLPVGISALVCCCVWDTWITDVFLFFCRSFRMPGLIFTLDLDGIIWLITVKILFAILSGLLSVICFVFGVCIASVMAVVAWPFSLAYRIKEIKAYKPNV